MTTMSSVQASNFRTARVVFDAWFDGRSGDREAWWLRLVAALWTESGCRILAHTGEWKGGGRINSRQQAVLAQSAQLYREKYGREPDGYGSNGGSVGALQQIPTEVSWIATKDGLDDGAPTPWAGWGTITDCMALETSVPKFLNQLRVTDDPIYKGKRTASPVVADLLRVQQPLGSEVATNYGQGVVEVAAAIAAMFPRIVETDWWTAMAENFEEAKQELVKVLDDHAPKAITFYDQVGGSHFVAYPNGTYVLVPNPMGDDGVLASHLGHLAKMGVTIVDIGASDPFMFGHRVEWSGRPDSTTAY